MTRSTTIFASWEIIPTAAPQPHKNCPSCARSRNFVSSGQIRLNANGKRLDAWLIYKCTHCDQTWNRPLLERKPVGQVSTAELEAMQQSSPAWVRVHEFDTASLKAHCLDVHHASEFTLVKKTQGSLPQNWSEIRLTVSCGLQTGLRLERVLCEGWRLSRSQLRKISESGSLIAEARSGNVLRKPLRGSTSVKVLSEGLREEMRVRFFDGVAGRS